MIKVPAIIYYLLVIAVRLRALFYCIVHFNNQKKLIISRLKKTNVSKQNKTIIWEHDKQENYKLNLTPRWKRFEEKIADCFYKKWRKYKLWKGKKDDWKDIVIRKDWDLNKIYLIQCKHWFSNRWVQSQHIREFQWSIDYYNKKFNKNAKWIFITTWITSQKAKETANLLWIHLWDTYDWQRKVNTFEW